MIPSLLIRHLDFMFKSGCIYYIILSIYILVVCLVYSILMCFGLFFIRILQVKLIYILLDSIKTFLIYQWVKWIMLLVAQFFLSPNSSLPLLFWQSSRQPELFQLVQHHPHLPLTPSFLSQHSFTLLRLSLLWKFWNHKIVLSGLTFQ